MNNGRDSAAELSELRQSARAIFDRALSAVDAGRAVRRAVTFDAPRLRILDTEFNLDEPRAGLYSVAAGKAAWSMAAAFDEIVGAGLSRGVVSAPASGASHGERWEVFAGGHPLPNEASVEAARAAFRILDEADRRRAPIVFLISGGGSAMLELPSDGGVTLDDLRATNRVLVTCGASIAEVNGVRRVLSAVKGGGLSARAPRSPQVTLVVSDVNAGREADVASGPTYAPRADAPLASRVVEKYDLASLLPSSVARALTQSTARAEAQAHASAVREHYVLLDNASAVRAAEDEARARGFVVETADALVEQHVAEGSAALVSRLFDLYRRAGASAGVVCVVSGGEFACPVRGRGTGGRNAETTLRCALEFEKYEADKAGMMAPRHVVALCAGTDGVDGNSPAAGALADGTTLKRAGGRGLDALKFLDDSDAHTFFHALGDTIVTGPTGTNVRDLRILLAV